MPQLQRALSSVVPKSVIESLQEEDDEKLVESEESEEQ